MSPTQKAYALLWRSPATDPLISRARKELLALLTKDEQREAIGWVLNIVGPMTDSEMIAADIRVGVFPKRSYPVEAQ